MYTIVEAEPILVLTRRGGAGHFTNMYFMHSIVPADSTCVTYLAGDTKYTKYRFVRTEPVQYTGGLANFVWIPDISGFLHGRTGSKGH
jgi:hypothetical protein